MAKRVILRCFKKQYWEMVSTYRGQQKNGHSTLSGPHIILDAAAYSFQLALPGHKTCNIQTVTIAAVFGEHKALYRLSR